MELIVFVVIVEGVFVFLGKWVAEQKDRSGLEGAVLGFLLGPLGILIEAMLPVPPPPVKLPRVTAQESERWRA